MLPSWIGSTSALKIQTPMRDSFHTASGWREVGVQYSAIPDPLHPHDPGVLEAIREFFPEAIYLRKLWVFRSPSDDVGEQNVVFVRHCIGSYIWNKHSEHTRFHVEMPAGADFLPPNQIDIELMHAQQDPNASDLPGAYVPFTWGVYQYLRTIFDASSTRERIDRYIRKKLERLRELSEKNQKAVAEMQNEIEKDFQKRFDALSDVEIAEHHRRLRAIREDRKRQFLALMEKASEKAPRVFVSRKDTES